MNEILIEDKKYVSSKRAAEITGYAKDYVGQLCREGRVPARLVGRSWYVLESAIQDHRFGLPSEQKQEEKPVPEDEKLSTWQPPRYEAAEAKILPSINRLEVETGESTAPEPQAEPEHAWDSWFSERGVTENAEENGSESVPEAEESVEVEKDGGESIAIHTVEQPEPVEEEVFSRTLEEMPHVFTSNIQPVKNSYSRGVLLSVQATGGVIAAIAVVTALLGTGYLDKALESAGQVAAIAGISTYDKSFK